MRTHTRILSVLTAVSLTVSLLSFSALAVEDNTESDHLSGCGYACTHTEHDADCGYTLGSDAVDCTNEPCDGTEDGHVEHQDAIPSADCGHECDDACQVWVCAEGCPVVAAAESQAKAEKVIAAIDALPGSVSYGDRDVIYAAKALFDALTEDEQSLVTNADVLTAALDAWKSITRWGSAQVVDQGHTSEGITYIITYQSYKDKQTYTQEQVEAMTPDEIKALKLFISTITYTIPENFEGKAVTLALTDAVADAMDYTVYMPGDAAPCKFDVINLSAHSYAYQSGSFFVSTENYTDRDWAEPSDIVGFDGQTIPYLFFSLRPANAAIKALYDGASIDKKNAANYLPDEKLNAQLALKSYDSLADYYLAYMNNKYGTDYAKLESFSNSQLSVLLGGTLVSYEIFETDPEVQALSYNYFYNHLFSVTPSGVKAPASDRYSVGSLMRSSNAGLGADSAFETGLSSSFGAIAPYAEEQENHNTYAWSGFEFQYNFNDLTNVYQSYNYSSTCGLTLSRTDIVEPEPPVDPPTPPSPDYYHVTVKYIEKSTGEELHPSYRTDSIRSGRDYDVTSEAALAITGYTIADVDGATSGTLRRDLTVTVYYTVDDTEIIDPAPPTTDKPEPTTPEVDIPDTTPPLTDLPTEEESVILPENPPLGNLPQTGTLSDSNTLFLTLASLSALLSAGLLVLTLSSRKKEAK